jgi:magnesium transporter
MADDFLFLTELLGLKVYDLKGRRLGLVKDAVIVPLIHPSRVDRFLVGGGWAWLTVRHDQIKSLSLDGIYLKDEQLTPYHSDEYMLRLVRDLLDQQIIDGQGRKVVRVTDVTFRIQQESDGQAINIIDVDIGLRSVLRRLVQGVIPPRWVRHIQTIIPPHSIRWDHCSIIEADPQRRLRLNISNKILERMHPADLADIVEDLSPDDREAIFETIDSEVAADTLSEMGRPAFWNRSRPRRPPISSRRCRRTKPRTCWRSSRNKLQKTFSKRWKWNPRQRWKSCWSIRKTQPAA